MRSIKNKLKSVKLIRALNSGIRDALLYLEYKINQLYFCDYSNCWSENKCAHVASELLKSRLIDLKFNKRDHRRPNIFFVGTYYDHEAQGFIQGLKKLGDIHVYKNIKGGYGINVDKSIAFTHDDERKWRNHLYESVVEENKIRPIDFVIGTFTAPTVSLDTLRDIGALGIPIINIAMDDMLPNHWRIKGKMRTGAFGLGPAVDLTLQTTPEFVQRYLRAGYPAIYFPFASDADIFYPRKEKDIDVLFIGNCYGKREKLIDRCVQSGINIVAYGMGFPNGHIAGDEVPQLFGRSKIILGSGLVGHSSSLYTLKLRDFDGPMSGGLYLTSHNPLLEKHFIIGEEIATYKNIDDCIKKIKYYLVHENERARVSANGRLRSCREHTWDSRFEILTKILNNS